MVQRRSSPRRVKLILPALTEATSPYWGSILRASRAHRSAKHELEHLAYSTGWKKFERAWDLVIRIKQLSQMRPLLEAVLAPVARQGARRETQPVQLASVRGAAS